MTTMVRNASGIPLLKSILGSWRIGTNRVTTQLTRFTEIEREGIKDNNPKINLEKAAPFEGRNRRRILDKRRVVINVMVPRYKKRVCLDI